MKTLRDSRDSDAIFRIVDVEAELENAVRALAFVPMDGGFEQVYRGEHPQIDSIYRNFERHVEEMVLQKARLAPIPWQAALVSLCETVDGEGIDWWLTGSAATAARGMPIVPGDLDLAVAAESADRFEALMIDWIVEPPRPGFISDTFTRAFRHACIEWVAGIDERVDGHMIGDVGPTAASRVETIDWRGYSICVPPLDLQLAVNDARGLTERAEWIRSAMAAPAAPVYANREDTRSSPTK